MKTPEKPELKSTLMAGYIFIAGIIGTICMFFGMFSKYGLPLGLSVMIGVPIIRGVYCACYNSRLTREYEKRVYEKKCCDYIDKCRKAQIQIIDSEEKKQKAMLIANSMDINERDISKFFDKALQVYTCVEKQEAEQAKIEQLSREEKTANNITRYKTLEGREKRITMLRDQKNELEQQKKAMDSLADIIRKSAVYTPEKDWAIAGGIAEGIAGPGAGLAVAASVQMENMQIREQNLSNLRAVNSLASDIQRSFTKGSSISSLAQSIREAETKMVSNLPKEEVFRSLSISDIKVAVHPISGTVTITASVSMIHPIHVYGDSPSVIDGCIEAELFRESQKVGSAFLVLPPYGVSQRTECIIGWCFGDFSPEIRYTVQFKPYKLWAMEK